MPYLNFPPNFKDIFDDLYARVRKLETAQRFTVPVVATDPTNTRKGDMWLNTTSNAVNYIDGTGAVQTFTPPPYVAGKNILINGGMDIWQRGTTSSLQGNYATADRWYIAGGGSITTNQDTDVPSGVPVQYSLNWTTTAGSSFGQFYQPIEQATVKTLRGQTVTASAWFKTAGTAYAGNLIFRFDYNTTSDTVGTGTWSNIAGTDVFFAGSSATSWVKKTSTFVVPSNAVGLRVSLIPDTVQSSGAIAKMTAAQLEIGSVATPFSRAGGTLSGELAACQRYYVRFGGNNAYENFASAFATSTTQALCLINFPVTQRIVASAVEYSTNALYEGVGFTAVTAFSINGGSTNQIRLQATVSSGLTQYRPYELLANASTSAYLGFSAEL